MRKVALLDGQTIQALPIAESLKKSGFYTILLCDNKQSYGYHTKFADRKILCPSTQNQPDKFHQFLLEFLHLEKIDVLIPLNDYSAHYLSLHADELRPLVRFFIPPLDIFMNGYDKYRLMHTCRINGFPHPRTHDLNLTNIKNAIDYVGFPAIIKPNLTTGARGFATVHSIDDIQNSLKKIIDGYGDCHLQELIPEGGKQYKVEIFLMDKQLINSTVLHKIRFYPEKGGSSCFNQTVRNDELVNICLSVLNDISWEGFADFDLIEDPRNGVIKIMEINPRIPACVKASFNAGVDFGENILKASLGEKPTKYEYHPGNFLRYLGLDILWFLHSKNRFKSKPSWFKALLSPNQYLQDGSMRDFRPFLYGTIGGLLKQMDPRFRASKKGMNN